MTPHNLHPSAYEAGVHAGERVRDIGERTGTAINGLFVAVAQAAGRSAIAGLDAMSRHVHTDDRNPQLREKDYDS